MEKVQFKGIFWLILASFFYGFYGVISRLIGIGFGVFFHSFARELVIFLILLGYLYWKKSLKKIRKVDFKWFVLLGILNTISNVASFVSYNSLAIGVVLFIFYASSTLGNYFLGRFFFRERLTTTKLISLVICFIGLLMVFISSFVKTDLLFLFLSSIAGLSAGGYYVFSKKISSKYPLAEIFCLVSLISVIVALPLIIILKEPISFPGLSVSWVALFFYALIAIGANLSVVNGFRYLQAQIGSLTMLLEPVFGILFGWIFFKENLTFVSLSGGILIMIGCLLPNLLTIMKQRR